MSEPRTGDPDGCSSRLGDGATNGTLPGGPVPATGTLKTSLTELIGMADKEFTLFELHFDGGFQLGPKVLGVGGEGEGEDVDEENEESEAIEIDSETGGGPGAAVLGLLALVVVAAVLRRVLGGEDDLEIETAAEHEDDVEEIESA